MNNYDYDYFIRKFEAIPDEQWAIRAYVAGDSRCAFGHCGMTNHGAIPKIPECAALRELIGGNHLVTRINDGVESGYDQPTPRARILAALHDAKSKAESALDAYETRPLLPVTKPEPVEVV